ncbi:MAG: hypothetical protein Q8S41_09380 [Lutibacter sp.]|nr:hypothetical protein [Lutibacter sp.]MDP3946176.1 hypothetical protein [Lutibacter sp.]
MITYLNKNISWVLTLLTISFFMVSCDQEDNTGFSTLEPTSPTLSLTTSVSSKSLIEDDSVYEFTATLSTVQLVDVKLFITQVSGDATLGDDYTVDGSITIPAGATSAKGKIKILSDDLIEATEKVKIQIGDNTTSNATIVPVFMEFTILNYTEGDLALDLSWAMSATTTDNSGNVISPTAFADMRLLISTSPNNSDVILEADGGSFESLVLPANTPNGTYYVVADFYAANKTIVRNLDLSLELNQAGVINGDSYSYPAAISNLGICDLNFYVMTKITKVGNTYTFTDVSTQSYVYSTYSSWNGIDADFDSQVSTKAICNGLYIKGLNAGWMLDWWGEVVTVQTDVFASIDATGKVTIAKQFLYTTTYNGAVQPNYFVYGSGTYNQATGQLYIKYDLSQGTTTSLATAIMIYGWPTPYFEATLTLAP